MQQSQDYYPELLGSLYIINAPWVFNLVFQAITPWMSEETSHKIHILGDNYKKELIEKIGKNALPIYMGGTCFCKNRKYEGCCPLVDSDEGKIIKVIPPREDYHVQVHIKESKPKMHSAVSWEFEIEARNIGFSVKFIPDKGNPVDILAYHKVKNATIGFYKT